MAVKRKGQRAKVAAGKKLAKRRPAQPARGSRSGGDLEKILALIRTRPGIRPSEINRLLERDQTDGLRGTLIKHGLIRKEKDGSAIRYYPV